MSALADKIEGLDGPYREVDCRIWCAVQGNDFDLLARVVADFSQWQAPRYTASLDAAMTLVPDGWRFGGEQAGWHDPNQSICEAWVWPFESSYDPDWQLGQETQRGNPDGFRGFAATPALALCAAALRAREASQ